MTQQNILEAAKQGNPKAIAALLNRNLRPKGITVKVASKPDGVLQILLEAVQAPAAEEITTFIHQGMVKLQPDGVRSLRIFGKVAGEEVPDWSREIELGALSVPVDQPPAPAPTHQQLIKPPAPVNWRMKWLAIFLSAWAALAFFSLPNSFLKVMAAIVGGGLYVFWWFELRKRPDFAGNRQWVALAGIAIGCLVGFTTVAMMTQPPNVAAVDRCYEEQAAIVRGVANARDLGNIRATCEAQCRAGQVPGC